jgi:hypothetical protein
MCERCKHKLIECPVCGYRNFLRFEHCAQCGLEFTDEMRAESERQWKERKEAIESSEEMQTSTNG